MAGGMNGHSIAAAAQSLDLFATRFCMPTPQALPLPVFVANAAGKVASHTPANTRRT